MTLKTCPYCFQKATSKDSLYKGREPMGKLDVMWFKHKCGGDFILKAVKKIERKAS